MWQPSEGDAVSQGCRTLGAVTNTVVNRERSGAQRITVTFLKRGHRADRRDPPANRLAAGCLRHQCEFESRLLRRQRRVDLLGRHTRLGSGSQNHDSSGGSPRNSQHASDGAHSSRSRRYRAADPPVCDPQALYVRNASPGCGANCRNSSGRRALRPPRPRHVGRRRRQRPPTGRLRAGRNDGEPRPGRRHRLGPVPDRVACGPGHDTVIVDRRDRVARDCERISRR